MRVPPPAILSLVVRRHGPGCQFRPVVRAYYPLKMSYPVGSALPCNLLSVNDIILLDGRATWLEVHAYRIVDVHPQSDTAKEARQYVQGLLEPSRQ